MRYALDRLALLCISLLGCLLLSQLVLGQIRMSIHSVTATLQPIGTGYALVDQPAVQERLWHLPRVNYVVESAFSYEDGLVGGNAAVADQDALVGYGVHDRVYLPGGHQDKYVYFGELSIYGSGTVALFATPTGGRFALLHLTSVALGGAQASAPYVYRGPVPAGVDDATGLAVQEALKGSVSAVGPRVVRGGTFVGISGWPSSYEYSNGSCDSYVACEGDSHLCSVSDATAQAWLLGLAEGHDLPKPKPPFPVAKWQAYTRGHHARAVPYRKHGKVRPEAHFWRSHEALLGAVMREESWHPVKRGHGYEVMPFTRKRLLYWPATHSFKVIHR